MEAAATIAPLEEVGSARAVARDSGVKRCVIGGVKRHFRQRLLHMARWWRSALYVAAGHVAGLTLVRRLRCSLLTGGSRNEAEAELARVGDVSESFPELDEMELEEALEYRRDKIRRLHMLSDL